MKAFYYDQDKCIGCRACQVACKDKNDNPVGILFRHVYDYEVGSYPSVMAYHFAATCNHCANPACMQVCPVSAIYKDADDGVVLIDSALCTGCKACVDACPYGVPQYNASTNLVSKCDSCYQLRKNGEDPACVACCPLRALEFGDYDELKAAHPNAVSKIAPLPDSTLTTPSTLIDARACALKDGWKQVYM